MISLIFADGTFTGRGRRSVVGEALRRELDPTKVRFEYLEYPADFGMATGIGDVSYAVSVRAGIRAVAEAVERTPYRAVVAGYSQGAAVAVHFARDVLPLRLDLIVDAVATLGDPHQPLHQHDRCGIARPLSVPCDRLSRYVPGDPIADLPLGSPLRSVADVTEWMSIRSPDTSRRWAERTLAKLPGRLQSWWVPWRWGDLASAGQYIGNYLGDHHTVRYVSGGHCARLARQIEGYV